MKIVKNPAKPSGTNIIGFIWDSVRVDLLAGETSEPLPNNVANEMLSRYSFLEKGAVIVDEVVEEKEKGEEEKKGTPLKGLKHLGDATLEKLETYGITTREVFFEKLATEKEVMKKLMTPIVFSKFIL